MTKADMDRQMEQAAAVATQLMQTINRAKVEVEISLLALLMAAVSTINWIGDEEGDEGEMLEEAIDLLRAVAKNSIMVQSPERH